MSCNVEDFQGFLSAWAICNFTICLDPFGSSSVLNDVVLPAVLVKLLGYKLGVISQTKCNRNTVAGKYFIELVNHFLSGGQPHDAFFIVSAVVVHRHQQRSDCPYSSGPSTSTETSFHGPSGGSVDLSDSGESGRATN